MSIIAKVLDVIYDSRIIGFFGGIVLVVCSFIAILWYIAWMLVLRHVQFIQDMFGMKKESNQKNSKK
jgi:hypothetical protein